MEQVDNDGQEAKRIVDEIRSSSSLGAVTDIQQRNGTTNQHLISGQQQLFQAAKLLDDGQRSLEQLAIETERLRNSKKTMDYVITQKVLSSSLE